MRLCRLAVAPALPRLLQCANPDSAPRRSDCGSDKAAGSGQSLTLHSASMLHNAVSSVST